MQWMYRSISLPISYSYSHSFSYTHPPGWRRSVQTPLHSTRRWRKREQCVHRRIDTELAERRQVCCEASRPESRSAAAAAAESDTIADTASGQDTSQDTWAERSGRAEDQQVNRWDSKLAVAPEVVHSSVQQLPCYGDVVCHDEQIDAGYSLSRSDALDALTSIPETMVDSRRGWLRSHQTSWCWCDRN